MRTQRLSARRGRDVADALAMAPGVGVPYRNLHAGVVGIAADGQAVVGGFATTVGGLLSAAPVHVALAVARGANPSPAADVSRWARCSTSRWKVVGRFRPADSSAVQFDDSSFTPVIWELSERERLVLVALGQRYLRHEAYPQPLSWSNVAEVLALLQPEGCWTPKRAEHVVAAVRARLAKRDVAGLTRNEVGEPVGNALNRRTSGCICPVLPSRLGTDARLVLCRCSRQLAPIARGESSTGGLGAVGPRLGRRLS